MIIYICSKHDTTVKNCINDIAAFSCDINHVLYNNFYEYDYKMNNHIHYYFMNESIFTHIVRKLKSTTEN